MPDSTITNEATNVTAGKPAVTGAVYRAPLGTTLPTSQNDTLNAAFAPMGYISDAGMVNSVSRDRTEIKAWGGDVVKNLQNKKTDTYKMKFIEGLNEEVLKMAYGDDNVKTVTAGLKLRANAKDLDHSAWVIDQIFDGGDGEKKNRIVIADGQPTSIEDIEYKDDAVVGFDTTITCYPSAALGGDTHQEYRDA